mmetsp:Transcript_13891/g.43056  ORF Transcript_13891/g.43056 Transcript_13891/m.43056 type:complete len:142 (-) Transcript_13891:1009-1434(-)
MLNWANFRLSGGIMPTWIVFSLASQIAGCFRLMSSKVAKCWKCACFIFFCFSSALCRRAQDQIVDALCVSCCYHLDLPKHTFHKYLAQSLFSDCGLNYLVNMVLSALKYGASSLAVNAVLENNHVSCTPDNLGRNVNHLTS